MNQSEIDQITLESLPELLKNDTKVKVAGVDVDGLLRGKMFSKDRFLEGAKSGFGFCSVIFNWDMHDRIYSNNLNKDSKVTSGPDLLAYPDLTSFRRIPWENNVPFFMVSYYDPIDKRPISVCPRSLLKAKVEQLKSNGFRALAGVEYEIAQFIIPASSKSLAAGKEASIDKFLREKSIDSLLPLTEGKFGYSMTRTVQNRDYFYEVFNSCEKFNCGIEAWHTESGPGVYEAALSYDEAYKLADKASLFKFVVKSIATKYGIIPCFMAKPHHGLPGNSAHMHVSLVDVSGNNIFAREVTDQNPIYEDIANLSDLGRYFLAGLLDGFPDVMPMFAPTINSYKRFDPGFWAPDTVSWGLEDRTASIRIIALPTAQLKSTRFEIRVPGADSNPFYVLATILSLGLRGIEKKLDITQPPITEVRKSSEASNKSQNLARNLKDANERFMRKDSVAREVFGDEFVDQFGRSRLHEIQQWEETVTDWEVHRYIERV